MNAFPQILTETHNQTLNLSSTAILTCHIRDLGKYHVTWFKFDPLKSTSTPLAVGKRLFTTDKRYSISFYSISTRDSWWSLEIYELKLSDEGIYTCKIANRKTSVSICIHLYIQIPMTIRPAYIHVEPGSNIKLNCTISMIKADNNTSPITWHFLSNRLDKRSGPYNAYTMRKTLNNDSTSFLIINNAQISNTGIWTCVYKHQRVSAKVIVQKGIKTREFDQLNSVVFLDIFRHQRASALLSNNSSRQISSISFSLIVLFIVYKH